MNKAILLPEIQEFIEKNLDYDLSRLILKGSPFPQVTIQEFATQIHGKQKIKQKLPTWYQTKNIFYPPQINIEQTSSEITAEYKAALVEGDSLIDITGGLGVDTYYFANRFKKVIHIEINEELSQIAAHNFWVLGKNNIATNCKDGIEFLKHTDQTFSCIYIDPARRGDYGGKVFLLEQCTPDITTHLDLLFLRTENILIKTSPLLDLTSGIRELQHTKEIHIVSVNNDVKELLWILQKDYSGDILIKTVNLQGTNNQYFEGPFDKISETSSLSQPLKFIYEPNPAVMKSGLFGVLAKQTNTSKLHINSHIYTSDVLLDFPGRRFEIKEVLPYSNKIKKSLGLKKANITIRNFPKSVETIRNELKIADGGNDYLFFTTNMNNEKIVLICEKTS
ncbi:hypothetical protein BH23BAC2_BH23BAC2_22920 [soil metagenome]